MQWFLPTILSLLSENHDILEGIARIFTRKTLDFTPRLINPVKYNTRCLRLCAAVLAFVSALTLPRGRRLRQRASRSSAHPCWQRAPLRCWMWTSESSHQM